ncbi:MAG: hypothetical protein PHV34_23365 [Verrucomicrobiae bacterium]|nr:hypothetical protein [Verrucomicrobiae bacterium]
MMKIGLHNLSVTGKTLFYGPIMNTFLSLAGAAQSGVAARPEMQPKQKGELC